MGGNSSPTITNVATGASFTSSSSNNNYGWTVGAGVEWAFYGNFSARLEYDYIDLNSQTFTAGTFGGYTLTSNNRNIQFVNLGINYKFGLW